MIEEYYYPLLESTDYTAWKRFKRTKTVQQHWQYMLDGLMSFNEYDHWFWITLWERDYAN